MSKFDERILKPSSDMFYFQIIPLQLTISGSVPNPLINEFTDGLSFKLFKGNLMRECR